MDTLNPPSEPAGALSQVVTDKKKKKKKKLTAKERAKEKLDKACEKILEDGILCNELFLSVGYWLKSKQKFLHKLLNQQCLQSLDHEMFKNQIKKLEEDNEEENSLEINTLSTIDFKITHDDFKMVARDLNIPCTNLQLHVLCKILDPAETGYIDYRSFTTEFINLQIKRQHLDGIKIIKGTEPTRSAFTFKKVLASGLNPPRSPHYIKLDLKLLTFANDKEFKGHIKDEIICTNYKILTLIELIKEKIDIVSMKISIFQDTSKSKTSHLDDNRTIESYGYSGKTYSECIESNEKVVFYFDYMILANDDPILNCDFYFHNYKSTPSAKKY